MIGLFAISTKYLIFNYHLYWYRLLLHFLPFGKYEEIKIPVTNVKEWFLDLPFYLMDVLLISYVYSLLSIFFKKGMNKLTEEEMMMSIPYFGENIDYEYVTTHSDMSTRIRKFALAYVSLNTINYKGYIKESVFIHEMVHIWQYQKYGSVYIGRALSAQKKPDAYDYGGVNVLYDGMIKGKHLSEFNFEQQAQIVQDAYEFQNRSSFMVAPLEQAIYEYFLQHIGFDKERLEV